MKQTKERASFSRKWKPELLVDMYLLTRAYGEKKACLTMGLNILTWKTWKKTKPEVKAVIDRAKSKEDKLPGVQTLQDYVYQNLSPELKEVWEELLEWEDHEQSWEKATVLLRDKPIRIRQQLFVHAMMHCSFSASDACRMVAIPKKTVDKWMRTSPYFIELMQEVEWHKKNFFEQGLVDLVKARHPVAVMFANRTLNKDRGYNEKLEIQHSGTIDHRHSFVVSVDDLKLPLEDRVKLLEAVRVAKTSHAETTDVPIAELAGEGDGEHFDEE